MIKIDIYKDNSHREICAVFYMGSQFTLYSNFPIDESFEDIIINIQIGLNSDDLISLNTRDFKDRKDFICSIQVSK